MNGRFFLDTNIFVYSFDQTATEKQRKARELIKAGLQSGGGHINFQVIQEFFNVALDVEQSDSEFRTLDGFLKLPHL